MAHPRHALGRRAEDAAAAWLEATGWTVLARRFRHPAGGEVDLIGLDAQGVLVGVEVRARGSRRAGAPEETVDARRVGRISRSLAAYAAGARPRHVGLRVDLVCVEPEPPPPPAAFRLRRVPNIGG